jgi:hypothetical protein
MEFRTTKFANIWLSREVVGKKLQGSDLYTVTNVTIDLNRLLREHAVTMDILTNKQSTRPVAFVTTMTKIAPFLRRAYSDDSSGNHGDHDDLMYRHVKCFIDQVFDRSIGRNREIFGTSRSNVPHEKVGYYIQNPNTPLFQQFFTKDQFLESVKMLVDSNRQTIGPDGTIQFPDGCVLQTTQRFQDADSNSCEYHVSEVRYHVKNGASDNLFSIDPQLPFKFVMKNGVCTSSCNSDITHPSSGSETGSGSSSGSGSGGGDAHGPGTVMANRKFVITKPPGTSGYSVDHVDGNMAIGPLNRGAIYDFEVNAPGHPFFLTTQKLSSGQFTVATYQGEYLKGVTNSRTENGTLRLVVPADAPDTLYYQCGEHQSMQGSISIQPAASDGSSSSTQSSPMLTLSSATLPRISDTKVFEISGRSFPYIKYGSTTKDMFGQTRTQLVAVYFNDDNVPIREESLFMSNQPYDPKFGPQSRHIYVEDMVSDPLGWYTGINISKSDAKITLSLTELEDMMETFPYVKKDAKVGKDSVFKENDDDGSYTCYVKRFLEAFIKPTVMDKGVRTRDNVPRIILDYIKKKEMFGFLSATRSAYLINCPGTF